VDAIMCGAKVVWIGPDMVQREFALVGSEGGGPGLEPWGHSARRRPGV